MKVVAGQIWKNKRSGKTVKILNTPKNLFTAVELQYESGRKGKKKHHYFIYDYDLVSEPDTKKPKKYKEGDPCPKCSPKHIGVWSEERLKWVVCCVCGDSGVLDARSLEILYGGEGETAD